MRKIGRIFFILICLCLLVGIAISLAPKAYAASAMTASESCIKFIKEVEGFSPQPYYDYNQHTVGYGTKCPTEKYFDYMVNGIPKKEADLLLREVLADIADTINNKLIDKYNLTLNQHQFDALVSFSFNIGTGWITYDSTLRNVLLKNADEHDLVYAFSLYCTAGGKYSSGLITRRLCEANMYLNGVYSQKISDAYGYVYYEANGGTLTYRVQGFVCENNSAPVADATKNGDVFLGWYTDLTGGTQITKLNRALTGKTLFARWQSSEDSEDQDSSSTVIKVTGDVVNIRKGPGTNYGIARQCYRNDILIVSHVTHLTNMKWGKVQDGWICLDYTNYDDALNRTDETDTENNGQPSDEATVPDNSPAWNDTESDDKIPPDTQDTVSGIVRVNDLLRIRSGPGTTYSTVGYLFKGNKVEILEQKIVGSTVWGQITRGWVCMDYIITDNLDVDDTIESDAEQKLEPDPEEEPFDPVGEIEDTAIKGRITADALRIRSGAGTTNSIVGFYYQNDIVVVSKKMLVGSDYWGKTNKGWINMDYVSADSLSEESFQPTEGEMMTVIADCLRIRKKAGTDQKIAALLYYGDTVVVWETKDVDGTVWGRVDKGWICMEYVN